jgi:hypothetical protein
VSETWRAWLDAVPGPSSDPEPNWLIPRPPSYTLPGLHGPVTLVSTHRLVLAHRDKRGRLRRTTPRILRRLLGRDGCATLYRLTLEHGDPLETCAAYAASLEREPLY